MLGGVGEQSGLQPVSVWAALSSFASEGEEFERRTKKNLRFETKKVEHWWREEACRGNDPSTS